MLSENAYKKVQTVVTGHIEEETIQIKVRNHKTEQVELLIYEHPWRWSTWGYYTKQHGVDKSHQSTLSIPCTRRRMKKNYHYTVRYTW